MRQLQLFSTAELAVMRDRTASRRYSAEREEFRREHARRRAWGLAQRHATKLHRLRGSGCEERPASVRSPARPMATRSAAASAPRPEKVCRPAAPAADPVPATNAAPATGCASGAAPAPAGVPNPAAVAAPAAVAGPAAAHRTGMPAKNACFTTGAPGGSRSPGVRGAVLPGVRGAVLPGVRGAVLPGVRGAVSPGVRGAVLPGVRGAVPPGSHNSTGAIRRARRCSQFINQCQNAIHQRRKTDATRFLPPMSRLASHTFHCRLVVWRRVRRCGFGRRRAGPVSLPPVRAFRLCGPCPSRSSGSLPPRGRSGGP